jgi:ABC-type molybdate transport system ATPase subunit
MTIKNVDEENGVVELENDVGVKIYAELDDESRYGIGNRVIVALRPQDVTLATHRIDDISIQNQSEGIIADMIELGNKVLCVVDIGFEIIVEVTKITRKKMSLAGDVHIWCLFKAASVSTLKIT